MMYPPTRFAVSVPGGMVGKWALSVIPSHQRSREPKLPPSEIATIDFHIESVLREALGFTPSDRLGHGYAFPRGLSVGIISRCRRGGSRRNAISFSSAAKSKGGIDCTQ